MHCASEPFQISSLSSHSIHWNRLTSDDRVVEDQNKCLSTKQQHAYLAMLRLQERYINDISDREYDDAIFVNLLRRYQTQINLIDRLNALPLDNQKYIIAIIEQIMVQFFKDENVEVPSQLKDLLRIKLLTLSYLQIALTGQDYIDSKNSQFFFFCSYNMVLKTSSVIVMNEDLENWIKSQKEQSIDYWNVHIFAFEEFLYQQLEWNVDLVTPADILNVFVDHHFRGFENSTWFRVCQDNILTCFMQQRWSAATIALGCLAHALSQLDDEETSISGNESEYLLFLINQKEYQVYGFDVTEIEDVVAFLQKDQQALLFDLSLIPSENENDLTPTQRSEEDDDDGQEDDHAANDICLEAEEEDLNDEELNESNNNNNMNASFQLNRKVSSNSSIATIKNYSRTKRPLEDDRQEQLNTKRSYDAFAQTHIIVKERKLTSATSIRCFEEDECLMESRMKRVKYTIDFN